ncbi:MAG: hypothetical protein AB4040_16295 [Synechococcus sp.]
MSPQSREGLFDAIARFRISDASKIAADSLQSYTEFQTSQFCRQQVRSFGAITIARLLMQ